MKRRLLVVAAALLAVLGVLVYRVLVLPPPDPAAKTNRGDKAPEFSVASTSAPRTTLAELAKGRTVVLVFYRGDW